MNPNARRDDFDSLMADWFDRDANVRPPERLLSAALARTTRTRPLPAWRLSERWLPLATLAIRRPAVPRGAYLLVAIALLIVAFVAALALGVGAHRLPPPLGPAANGRIAYIAGGQLYTASSTGADVHQLTAARTINSDPAFSNDGTKILYATANTTTSLELFLYADLNVVDTDGSHPRVLLTNARGMSNAAWSPDGRYIAVSTTPVDGADHVLVIAADGSGVTDLGDFGSGAWAPSWSPDGQRLAMIVNGNGGSAHIWIVNRDGSNPRQISQGSYPAIGEDGAAAEWSPDGTLLLFAAGMSGSNPTDYYGQFIVGLDGAPERRIDMNGNDGVWSPDGSRIAYLRAGTGSGPSVVIADRTGKELRVLPGEYAWHMPVWSPDGTRIAIADDRPGVDNVKATPVTVILDAIGDASPVVIPGVLAVYEGIPSFSATWQRLAP